MNEEPIKLNIKKNITIILTILLILTFTIGIYKSHQLGQHNGMTQICQPQNKIITINQEGQYTCTTPQEIQQQNQPQQNYKTLNEKW